MSRRSVNLTHRRQRSVLTDMLPFEVPPTFTSRGFYAFLRDHRVELEDGNLRWKEGPAGLEKVLRLVFGVKPAIGSVTATTTEWGGNITRRSIELKACRMETTPFNFRVAHRLEGRTLSVPHPRNQVRVADFYARHGAIITYYCSVSPFSIRHPVSVARFAYFKDKLHLQDLDSTVVGVEEVDREYEQIGSFFVYRKYRNIHRFFESYDYHRCERKYDAMVQIDVSKCFDSIYTHSLPWATLGRSQTKFNLLDSKTTFGGRFDAVMQHLNQGETNGIVIGPEFSRIFAEIILQAADVELERALLDRAKLRHKNDYEVFRYVDDYFVFYNDPSTEKRVLEELQEILKARKLSINSAKVKSYPKPIITEITIAKERVSMLMNAEIDPRAEEAASPDPDGALVTRLVCDVKANRLIVRYKTIIKESRVEYGELLNYTFAILERKIDRLIKAFVSSGQDDVDRRRLTRAMQSLLEFAFFAYSASPKVNHTIRLCRMVTTSVDFVTAQAFPHELKHLLFKFIHDNVREQLEKNRMGPHREVESLYLLVVLPGIGREYWLPQDKIARHFRIEISDATGDLHREGFLTHFSITVLLTYVKRKKRYDKLRSFIETQAVAKLEFVKAHCPNDAEALILLLDLITCPYVDDSTKHAAGKVFGLNPADVAAIEAVNDQWFTAWGPKFKLAKELDAKRSREVY
jgi:hypothetical protein